MPDVDKELVKSLQEAKKKPRNFAIVAKGPNVVKLLVSKKPIKDGELLKAKKECQGNVICRGVCCGDGADLVFQVTADQPSIAEPKFKAFLKDQTGLALKPRFEVVAEVPEIDESDEAGQGPVDEPTAPSPADEARGKQLLAALNKLTPALKAAVAAHPERKADLLRPVAEIQRLVQSGAVQDAEANFVTVAQLVKQLAAGGPAPEAKPQVPEVSLVALQKSRLAWDGLRKKVQSELQALERHILEAIRTHNADETAEEEYDEQEVAAAVKQLYTILDKLDARLIDKLDEALNAQDAEQRQARHREAAAIIKEYQAFADQDPLLATIDDNGFTSCSIRKSVVATLNVLASKL